jgi:hypothetical protein
VGWVAHMGKWSIRTNFWSEVLKALGQSGPRHGLECNRNRFLLFMSMGWSYVSERRPPTGPLFIPRMYMSNECHSGMILTGKTEELGEKPSQCHFVHHKFSLGMTRARTCASAVRSRILTTWAMVRPNGSRILKLKLKSGGSKGVNWGRPWTRLLYLQVP